MLSDRDPRLGSIHLFLGKRDFCAQAIGQSKRVIKSFLRLDARFAQLLGALQLNLGVTKLDFQVCDSRLSGVAVRFRRIKCALVVGIVELSEKLALIDACPFIKENASDAACNFGSDRGPAARGDVPARI